MRTMHSPRCIRYSLAEDTIRPATTATSSAIGFSSDTVKAYEAEEVRGAALAARRYRRLTSLRAVRAALAKAVIARRFRERPSAAPSRTPKHQWRLETPLRHRLYHEANRHHAPKLVAFSASNASRW